MERIQKPKTGQLRSPYTVLCTECGDKMDKKLFRLDPLIKQYFLTAQSAKIADNLFKKLTVNAFYGQKVFFPVRPLLNDENEIAPNALEDITYEQLPERFSCENNAIPTEKLSPISLNISNIVAQFCHGSGFDVRDMREMLSLYQKKEVMSALEEEEAVRYDQLCAKFSSLPDVSLAAMSVAEKRQADIETIFSNILALAMQEIPLIREGSANMSFKQYSVGWRYRVENSCEMPYSLVACSEDGVDLACDQCCCPHCHHIVDYRCGAYRQRVVGILGTQSTGKTTYLTALTDMIDGGYLTSLRYSDFAGSLKIMHALPDDLQWKRFMRAGREVTEPAEQRESQDTAAILLESSGEPTQSQLILPNGSAPAGRKTAGKKTTAGRKTAEAEARNAQDKVGSLWLYQHGYPPIKTHAVKLEAPVLNFLVSNEKMGTEPVMYTLADVPGEAFDNEEKEGLDKEFVNTQHRILRQCDALFMVISQRQFDKTTNLELQKNPNQVLASYQDFLPEHPVPTVIVMTGADEICGGDLRGALQVAYDVRELPALVQSEFENDLVLNTEAMYSLSEAVKRYINWNFGNFVKNIEDSLSKKSSDSKPCVAAFSISSGTQYAPQNYTGTDPEYDTPVKMQQRYQKVCKARFGVEKPMLWLLGADGMLQSGRAANEYNRYDASVQKAIRKKLQELFYR